MIIIIFIIFIWIVFFDVKNFQVKILIVQREKKIVTVSSERNKRDKTNVMSRAKNFQSYKNKKLIIEKKIIHKNNCKEFNRLQKYTHEGVWFTFIMTNYHTLRLNTFVHFQRKFIVYSRV